MEEYVHLKKKDSFKSHQWVKLLFYAGDTVQQQFPVAHYFSNKWKYDVILNLFMLAM